MDIEVVAVDAAGNLIVWNEAARASDAVVADLPETAVEECAETFSVTRPDGGRLETEQLPISRALAGHRIIGEELETHVNGNTRRLSINARPILLPDGTKAGAVCTRADVSALHLRETELARANADLDAIARATTQVLNGEDARPA